MIQVNWFVDAQVDDRRSIPTHGSSVSRAIQAKLVQSVFDQRSSMIVGAVSMVVFGMVCCVRSGQPFFVAWTSLSLLVFAARLTLAHAYTVRAVTDETLLWARRFVIGSALTGLIWGVGSGYAILYSDPVLQMMMLTGQTAHLTIACVRNNAIPKSAIAQCTLPPLMSALACFLKFDVYYTIYAFFIFTHLAATLQITMFVYRQTLNLLIAEERAASKTAELADANERLVNLSITDGLTGVVNRRGFDQSFGVACDRAKRGEISDLSILLLDIDFFKLLNDRIGHQAGDECLRRLGTLLKASVRSHADIAARYGGEEFAFVLPDTTSKSAARFAEGLRAAVERLALPNPGSPLGIVTISIGCATLTRGVTVDPGALLKAADDALYGAKTSGRNRVERRRPGDIDYAGAPDTIAA